MEVGSEGGERGGAEGEELFLVHEDAGDGLAKIRLNL